MTAPIDPDRETVGSGKSADADATDMSPPQQRRAPRPFVERDKAAR
ncbi:hypothetical protein [Paraburkholderia phosphatilytica]|nr:hypothetical protein [Paraburkholderia phosphatilytica]